MMTFAMLACAGMVPTDIGHSVSHALVALAALL
jgi:hypothetical protein